MTSPVVLSLGLVGHMVGNEASVKMDSYQFLAGLLNAGPDANRSEDSQAGLPYMCFWVAVSQSWEIQRHLAWRLRAGLACNAKVRYVI